MNKIITVPLIQNGKFEFRKGEWYHIRSWCCDEHADGCKCGFCTIHYEYMNGAIRHLAKIAETIR